MGQARVVWSPTALLHFEAWIRFIAKDSERAARRERDRLLKSTARLSRFPRSGRVVPEFKNPTLREVVKRPIRVIYRLKGNAVEILTFHHSKRELALGLFI